ncbi:MAG: hypothetical protein ABIZ36_11630 [Gemmatimonadaceae bacterium]
MYIELIDLLRCPRPHEESWLVAAFNKMDGRFVIEGKLGCPICSASYPIKGGTADFRDDASCSTMADPPDVATEEMTLRIAGMLGLTRAGAAVVLSRMPSELANSVAELTGVRVICVNSVGDGREAENVASVRGDEKLPLASGSIDAMMLAEPVSARDLDEALRVLKTGSRLVAPAASALGGNLRELARDERYIVAEFTGPLVGLSRQPTS